MMIVKRNRLRYVVVVASSLIIVGNLGAQQEPMIAATPPMGWNSWGGSECNTVTDKYVRQQADIMVSNGMKAAGYEYVNIDACWQGGRDAQGNIRGNERFPDMKNLIQYVHSKGLKFGLYSSPGPKTCAGDWDGSYGHEEQDARSYAEWGVDYLKYDWCTAGKVYSQSEMQTAYKKMGDALRSSGRPIVYALSSGTVGIWGWAPSVGANLWRTTSDLMNNWYSMSAIGFEQNGLERFAGPGHWNDPDMLYVIPEKVSQAAGGLKVEENRTQMSLWSLLAAPLIVSADLSKIPPDLLAILTNKEVIAVDQDQAGIQGRRVSQEGPLEVWMKPLANGAKAIGLFNRGERYPSGITVYFRDIDVGDKAAVRDLWAQKNVGSFDGSFTATVPSHGVVMLEIKSAF